MYKIMSIRNLIYLTGGTDIKHRECSNKIIENVMDEFKNKELKDKANKIIKNKKQALAIALTKTQTECPYNLKELINKVNNDLNDKEKELNLTNIIETKEAIKLLHKKGKLKKIYIFKKLLWNKIISSQKKNIKLNKNFWDEINEIHNL